MAVSPFEQGEQGRMARALFDGNQNDAVTGIESGPTPLIGKYIGRSSFDGCVGGLMRVEILRGYSPSIRVGFHISNAGGDGGGGEARGPTMWFEGFAGGVRARGGEARVI